jgi:hypothetical protein
MGAEPVECGVLSNAATIAPIEGWLVMPLIESTAASTASAPALAHSIMLATPVIHEKGGEVVDD